MKPFSCYLLTFSHYELQLNCIVFKSNVFGSPFTDVPLTMQQGGRGTDDCDGDVLRVEARVKISRGGVDARDIMAVR